MNITLQVNTSDKIRIDKDVTDVITFSGTLKDATSIIDPVILFEGDLTNYMTCNYMTIPIFNRSYFITNLKAVRRNLFEISGHVDVLSSFAAGIRGNTAIIKRQENNWNLYLNDGSFRTYQNPMVLTKEFPSGFTTQEFVLSVAGA